MVNEEEISLEQTINKVKYFKGLKLNCWMVLLNVLKRFLFENLI